MKKILFLIAFFGFTATAVFAQTAKVDAKSTELAVKAAQNNPDIIIKKADDGTVSFKRKSVCPMSGKVSYTPVSYNAKTKTWDKASCSAASAKSCSKSASKAGCSGKSKACCAGKGKKACCAGKKSCSKAGKKK